MGRRFVERNVLQNRIMSDERKYKTTEASLTPRFAYYVLQAGQMTFSGVASRALVKLGQSSPRPFKHFVRCSKSLLHTGHFAARAEHIEELYLSPPCSTPWWIYISPFLKGERPFLGVFPFFLFFWVG